MSTANSWIRGSTIAAVGIVAGVAGYVSYQHAHEVVLAAGETGLVAWLYPATIDGLIYSAGMVLLDSARRRVGVPWLAWWLLAAGMAATLAANVAAGLAHGTVGAIVAAWPALALMGAYELLMLLIRGQTGSNLAAAEAADAIAEAAAALDRSIEAGNALSQRKLAEQYGIGRDEARRLHVGAGIAAANGAGAHRKAG